MNGSDGDRVLLDLLQWLGSEDYRFVPPTPETHKRVVARTGKDRAADLRDAFGWSLPFDRALLPAPMYEALLRADALENRGDLVASRFRVASLEDRLFLHSAFPTTSKEAVFLGPDSYRFVRFLDQELPQPGAVDRLVDVGTGAGVGAIMAARRLPGTRITLTDINPAALRLARINARYAGVEIEACEGPGLDPVAGGFELVIANPPFMLDPDSRAYRDGGGPLGGDLSLQWASAALRRLPPGGCLLLYTGSAIAAGEDALEASLRRLSAASGFTMRYSEIDPDIFGEELDSPAYEHVERIAAVGAVLTRPA